MRPLSVIPLLPPLAVFALNGCFWISPAELADRLGAQDESNAGDTGDTSDTTETGDPGDTVETGETGETGGSSETGETTETGETPETGDSGDSVETGETGGSSDTGETGDTVDVDTADTGTADCDADDDGFIANTCGGDDCDDTDSWISPVEPEACNGVDDDCDGATDEPGADGELTWYSDDDGDGYGAASSSSSSTTTTCDMPSGYSATADDCDDTEATIHPAAYEYCNELDDNCDGTTDESSALDAPTWYRDTDGDSFGDGSVAARACDPPAGYIPNDEDCADTDAAINPDAAEVCDLVDNDCDGAADENEAVDATTWFEDGDGDGYGADDFATQSCSVPAGHVAIGGDCDDADASIKPGAAEVCDGHDGDCNGTVDDSAGCPCYPATADSHAYMYCASEAKWDDAQAQCEAYGYDLVTISSDTEWNTIEAYISSFVSVIWYWSVGLNDQRTEGDYVWVSEQTGVAPTWATGEPSGSSTMFDESDCGYISSIDGANLMYDGDCGLANSFFICEAG